jgi:hypothetical protein
MPFQMICSAKGCGEQGEPYLDPSTNKVHCSSCHAEIPNVSPITKNQMKMNKQFRKNEKKSFSLLCPFCKFEDRPTLKGDEAFCSNCNKKFDKLTKSFILMLKDKLKGVDKDVI